MLPINLSTLCVYFGLCGLLVGCGGSNAVRNENINQATNKISLTSNKALNSANYRKILDTLGLKEAFDYGTVRVTDDLITVPLTPKDINLDPQHTGTIIKETELLKKLGQSIASAINDETGVPKNQIKTIIYEVKCEVSITNSKVIKDCDRSFPTKYSEAKYNTIRILRVIYFFKHNQKSVKTNQQIIERREELASKRREKNKRQIHNFCSNTLKLKLKKLNPKSFIRCNLSLIKNNNKEYFLIQNIQTEKFISDGYTENFNLLIENSPLQSKQTPTVKILPPKNNYNTSISNPYLYKDIRNANIKISTWLVGFIESSKEK